MINKMRYLRLVFTICVLCDTLPSPPNVHALHLNIDLIKSTDKRSLQDRQSAFGETVLERTKRHSDDEEYDIFGKEIMGNEEGSEEEFVHIYNHDLEQYNANQKQSPGDQTQSEQQNEPLDEKMIDMNELMGKSQQQTMDTNEAQPQQNMDIAASGHMTNDKTGDMDTGGREVSASKAQKAPKPTDGIHGGIQMGVKNHQCDDGKTDLELDWDNRTDWEYSCTERESLLTFLEEERGTLIDCLPTNKVPRAIHTCMRDPIDYEEIPPRGGKHRPLWAMFGEYLYCPPERWVHNLEVRLDFDLHLFEYGPWLAHHFGPTQLDPDLKVADPDQHGSAVFLYHPCADADEIEKLKSLARSCMRKHVITPYKDLGTQQPFAVVTWGCKWQGNYVNENEIIHFVRAHAQQTVESSVERDGQYTWGLLHQAALVSDINDVILCPVIYYDAEHMVQDATDKPTQTDDVTLDNFTLPPMK